MAPLDSIKHLLILPQGKESWGYINSNEACFIWDDLENCIRQWNQVGATPYGLALIQEKWDKSGCLFLTYKESTEKAPLAWNPNDALLIIHAMTQMVKSDSEIRYCVDSWHGSQRAFSALPPITWSELESAFGKDLVTEKFAPLPACHHAFIREMISKHPFKAKGQETSNKSWWKFW